MKLHYEPVTAENRPAAEALDILPEQAGFIESVHDCLAEADEDDRWNALCIYDGETLIGFAMYGAFREGPERRVWLDRLLIDGRYQGHGCGTAAMVELLHRLCGEYGTDRIYLSVYADNVPAIRIYEGIGCRFNGEKDLNGEDIMVFDLV